jgi:diguanylate cyclase
MTDASGFDYRRAAERAVMASQRIQDLAKGMASDVGEHTTQVEAMTTDLQSIVESHPDGRNGAMFMAIGRIVEANSQLQQRLTIAEKQIEVQAGELRSYESEARTDSLTGLANRRAFDDEMKRRYSEWQRRQTKFSLLILDLDHFKRFNDTHGHPAGDELLRTIGSVLVNTARQMDMACRYGGEEFAVVLPATEMAEAKVAAERFRTAIESSITKFDGKKHSVTASIGIAQVNEHDDTLRLIRRADEALYRSKEAGRNCCHWHDGQRCLSVLSDGGPSEQDSSDDNATLGNSLSPGRTTTGAAFVAVLQRRVVESHRFGLPLSLLQLQVDDFQSISQRYGKAAASLAIDSVATFFHSALREMDLLAQLDGGEFVAMLPGSTTAEATQVVKRMQTAVANCTFPIGDKKVQLQFTHGVAQLQPNETAERLMARAKAENESPNLAAV